LDKLVRIDDPGFYDDPYDGLARMRRETAAYYLPALDTYVIGRHADVLAISKSPEVWSSASGVLVNDVVHRHNIGDEFFPPSVERLMTTDPPRHRFLRRIISPSMTPRATAALEPVVREFCRDLVARIEPGTEIDFVERLAVPVPLWVIAKLFGLPGDNLGEFREWSDLMMNMGGDFTREELLTATAAMKPMNEYFRANLDRRKQEIARSAGSEDLMTILVQAEIDHVELTYDNVLGLSLTTLVAGNETTRNLLGWMALAFASHPDQIAALVADPSLAGPAVDEALRWASPVPGFVRTATVDTEVGGVPIRAGQHAYLLYMSANWDETVFENPDRFDVRRKATRAHVAFGFGEHVCPGASITRLESQILFEELITRFSSWELAGEPTKIRSTLQNGWAHVPVVFNAR
jgi:cytochrome P450